LQSFGFSVTYSGANPKPIGFSFNDAAGSIAASGQSGEILIVS
jgi:hypothetical protein